MTSQDEVGTFHLPTQLCSPEGVLAAMTAVAQEQNCQQFTLLQESVLLVAEKVKNNASIERVEQDFILALFDNPWWGGEAFGFNESLPQSDVAVGTSDFPRVALKSTDDQKQLQVWKMTQHFLHGGGRLFAANLPTFKTSIVVADAIQALKSYIAERIKSHKPITKISTCDRDFIKSPFAKEIEKPRREIDTLGYIFSDGTLMLEQKDPRQRNFENRFRIDVITTKLGEKLSSRWCIRGHFKFESFGSSEYFISLPLTCSMQPKIPAGLGAMLVDFNKAKPFEYFIDWAETYQS